MHWLFWFHPPQFHHKTHSKCVGNYVLRQSVIRGTTSWTAAYVEARTGAAAHMGGGWIMQQPNYFLHQHWISASALDILREKRDGIGDIILNTHDMHSKSSMWLRFFATLFYAWLGIDEIDLPLRKCDLRWFLPSPSHLEAAAFSVIIW